jgi:glycosyltransferase involved in cell wall biosynthesis
MISFIIIGKNIENTVSVCIKSIIRFIQENDILNSEIIYVDSDSNDRTIDIAEQYGINILVIKGEVNAAIGRNVGAEYSSGDVLFFIDGDMEIFSDLYRKVFNNKTMGLKYPFTTGYWKDRLYDNKFNYLFDKELIIPNKNIFLNATGGLMILERKLWKTIGGMDERLIRHQDHDIGLRLSKIGFPAKRYNHLFAIHHTVSYFDSNRFITFYFSKALLSQGILMRKHLFNIAFLKRYSRNIIYVFYLLIIIIMLFFSFEVGGYMFLIYTFIQVYRTIKDIKYESKFFHAFLSKMLYNFYALFGFLFYFPRKKKYQVNVLNENIKPFNIS